MVSSRIITTKDGVRKPWDSLRKAGAGLDVSYHRLKEKDFPFTVDDIRFEKYTRLEIIALFLTTTMNKSDLIEIKEIINNFS